MRIDLLSLFPEIAAGALSESILKRAQQNGLVEIGNHNLRDWTTDRHRTTDDTPYGGGPGMVMKCEPIFAAVEALTTAPSSPPPTGGNARPTRIVVMSPGGRLFNHSLAAQFAQEPHLIVICGHYEGIDQRVIDHLVDEEISIGNYVLTNGVIAALVFVDAIVRLVPGVLGDAESARHDSFTDGLLEGPQYTRPAEFRNWRVPDILLSGNHAAIAEWRRTQAVTKTRTVRPDLLSGDDNARSC